MSDIILNTELRLDESKLRQSISRIEQQLKFRGPFAGMAGDVSRFDHELNRATQRVITLGTAFQLLGSATRTIREIASATVQVEKALTDINSVFRLTNENLSKFSGNLFSIARETAKSFDEVSKAAVEFSRQGLSVQKTQEAVRAAMILSRDANIDVAVSVRALTAAVNSFQKEGISYTQVINRLAAADSAFAVSSKDLQEALIRVGSAASDVGVNFNELIALVTSAQQITARGGSVIAGALNTIFTRINRRDTLDALEALGVAISDTEGRMLPTLNVLQNFAKAYDRMTGSVKNQAAELVGGVRQLNTLKAVLTDLSRENSVFAQSLREVENAQDAAERRNAARNQSLSARLAQLRENGREIAANVGTIGFEGQAKGILGALNNNLFVDALRNAGDLTNDSFGAEAGRMFIKGFGNAIMFGLTPILATVMYRVSRTVFGNLTGDIKSAVMIKNTAQEHAALEKQIVALYQSGGAALQQQLSAMTSLTQQAAVFAQLMGKAQASSGMSNAGQIASMLMAQGRGPIKTPRAAGGYIPFGEESTAISRGVGGAPSSARPVYLPNFNRGGGQKGIVANTSEFIVPHLAGGSAIYNREMIQKYGLPPGATPVAAEGYIPTASFGYMLGMPGINSPFDYPQRMMRNNSYVPGGGTAQATGQGFGQFQYIPPFVPHLGSFGPSGGLYGSGYMPGWGGAVAGGQGFGQYQQSGPFHWQQAASLMPTFYINQMMSRMGSALPASMKNYPQPPPLSWDQQILQRWGPPTSMPAGSFNPSAYMPPPHLGPTFAEKYFQRMFGSLTRSDLSSATGLSVSSSASDRYSASQAARGAAIGGFLNRGGGTNLGAVADAIQASRGLGYGQTLSEQFDKTVKEALQSGKGLQTAYIAAINELKGETDNRKQINRIIRNSIPTHVAYEKELKESQVIRAAEKKQIERSVQRQVILNAATQQIEAGQNLQALTPQQRTAYVNLIRQRAMANLGFDTTAMFNPEARAQVNAVVAKQIADLNARGAAINPITGAMGMGPVVPWGARLRNAMSSQMGTTGSMALAMGLPFAGAQIDPGMGGTSSGMWRGAASTGLSMAGFGASIGMMTGNPLGPLAGAGIGALFGGLIGAIRKSTQSFEELTLELDQSKKKMVENYEAAAQFLRLQEDLEVAKSTGQKAREHDISRQQVQLLAGMSGEARSAALGLREDPLRMSKIAQIASKAYVTQESKSAFQAAINRIADEDFESKDAKGAIGPGLRSIMAAMTPESLKSLEAKINSGDSMGALTMLANVAGVDPKSLKKIQLERFVGQIGGDVLGATGGMVATETGRKLGPALSSAFGEINQYVNAPKGRDFGASRISPREILRLISTFDFASMQGGIRSGAEAQLFQAAQAASLGQPMSSRDRLILESQQAMDAIRYQSQSGQSQLFNQGRLNVSQALQSAGVRDRGLFARAGNLSNIGDILQFRRALEGKELASTIDPNKIDSIKNALDELAKTYFQIEETERANLNVIKQIGELKLEEFDLDKDYNRVRQRLLNAAEEEAERRESVSLAMMGLRGSPFVSGAEIESGLMGGATNQGMWGNARGSFAGGFQSRFAGLKQDVFQFAEIGNRVAQSLESNLGNAFGDFVTGANTAKNAFRSFAISVLSDASRMFASKALQSFISFIPGFTPAGATGGEFTGTGFRFAGGGMVPSLLTGGEFYVSPKAAKRIGYDTLRQLNRYAEGGLVRGGSGVKDDVPARLPPGSFIIKKSATERLGSDYLQSLVDGRVQGRFWGGDVLMGGLLGGGLGALVGGKKGALIGAGIGALGGAAYGMMGSGASTSSSGTHSLLNVSTPSPDLAAVAAEPATMMPPFNVSASKITAPWWKPALYGLGAAGVLGLAANALSPKSGPGPISAAQVPAFRAGLEAQQSEMFSKNRYAYLTVNPQGGYSLGSFGPELATRRWSDGGTVSGGVDMAVVPGPHGGGSPVSAPQVSVKIEINNNGQVSSKSGSTGGDDGPFGADFGTKLEKSIRPIVQDELIRQSRNDGFFSQRSRYMNG